MRVLRRAHFVYAAVGFFLIAVIAQLALPLCWNDLTIRSDDSLIRRTVQFASTHSQVRAPLKTQDEVDSFLRNNPNCCRILDRSDPFYAPGIMDRFFGAQTKVVEIIIFSKKHNQNYTLYVWVNRCNEIVEYVGTET